MNVPSAFLGVLLVVVPSAVYYLIAFKNGLVLRPVDALRRHKRAMYLKFAVNLLLFAVVAIAYRHCNFAVLLVVYLLTYSGYWFSLVVRDK